jgi:hypothetical protein
MPKFDAPLDLSRAELRNAVTQNLGTAPAAPIAGLRYFDSILTLERYWDGTKWVDLSDTIDATNITGLGALAYLDQVGAPEIVPGSISDVHISDTAAIALSKLAVDPLNRANHTGTQLAATISDFDAQVHTSRLDQMSVPTATVDFGGQVLTGLGDPVLASDATNKAYVDQMSSGIDVKTASQAASTANVDISAPGPTIDGVTLVNGDRVLLKDQTAATENGIYVFNGAAAAMTRSTDADEDAEVKHGLYTFVTAGTTNMNSGWMLNTNNPIVVGTTPLSFVQFSGGGSSYVGTPNRITVTGTQIDIAGTYAGQASITTVGTITTGTWNGTPIDIAYGGTGATTAAGARLALGTIGKYPTTIGDGAAKTFTVTHGLNTTQVGVELYEVATGQTVYADVRRTDANNIVIDGFVAAPATNALGVLVWG